MTALASKLTVTTVDIVTDNSLLNEIESNYKYNLQNKFSVKMFRIDNKWVLCGYADSCSNAKIEL
jgi:hypothetical protein